MIYSNIEIKSVETTYDFGTISEIQLGEKGRGRMLMKLPCPNNVHIKKGENSKLSVGLTRSGRPRINYQKDERVFILVNTQGGYTRRGDGYCACSEVDPHKANIKAVAWGNGADGAAGRIGQWICYLFMVENPTYDLLKIQIGGGLATQFICVHEGHCTFFNDYEAYQIWCDVVGKDMLPIPDCKIYSKLRAEDIAKLF